MQRFVHTSLPARVVFGRGSSAGLAQEVQQLGLKRVLVLSTPGQAALAQRLATQLGSLAAGIHPHAVMHVPATVVDAVSQKHQSSLPLQSVGSVLDCRGNAQSTSPPNAPRYVEVLCPHNCHLRFSCRPSGSARLSLLEDYIHPSLPLS